MRLLPPEEVEGLGIEGGGGDESGGGGEVGPAAAAPFIVKP